MSNLRAEGSKTDKRKQSLYFPESIIQQIKEEAARLDRSLSWVVQRAWKISRLEIKKLPSVNEGDGRDDDEGCRDRTMAADASGAAGGAGTSGEVRTTVVAEDGTRLYVHSRSGN